MSDDDIKDISEIGLTKEERRTRREIAGLGGGCGIFCIPLVIPILVAIAMFLYPVPGALALGTWYVCTELAEGMGMDSILLWIVSYIPAGIVLWSTVRWDIWLGENFAYWLARHVVRNLLFFLLLFIATCTEGIPDAQSDEEMIDYYFHNAGGLAISAGALGFFNFILIGKQGFCRQFWHALLEIVRMEPATE